MACGAPAADGRLLFALPWQERLAIGTWHGSAFCGADAVMVTADEFDAFLPAINEAFPTSRLTADDVTLVQRGVVPAHGFRRPTGRWPIGRCCGSIVTTASTAPSR